MSQGLLVTSSNVKELDNYVLYRVWKEATTKKERSLAMKEIKRRQSLGNMVDSHKTSKIPTKVKSLVLRIYKNEPHRSSQNTYLKAIELDLVRYNSPYQGGNGWELTDKGKFVAGSLIGTSLDK